MAVDAALDPGEDHAARFRTLLEAAPCAVAVLRLDSRALVSANARLCRLLGRSEAELVAAGPDTLGLLPPASPGEDRRLPTGHGPVPVRVTSAVVDAADSVVYAVVFVEERLAPDETSTDVGTRRQFEAAVARQLAIATRHDRTGAVLVADVDRFRLVNDALGGQAGDMVLRQVAAVLGDRLRDGDMVGRLGGDEFGVLLAETGAEGAERVAAELIDRVRDAATVTPVTVSVGIAPFPGEHPQTADDVLACAVAAVDDAKRAGGSRAVVSTGRAASAFTWHHEITRALADERLTLFAQPIRDTADDGLSAHELLLRMVGDDGELVGPAAFLPTAERFGLITALDRWVIRRALALAGERPLNVNLSAQSLGDASLLDWLTAELRASDATPDRLLFEITETAAITELGGAIRFVEGLRALGCGIALDDFGAGFSSFRYLKHLPVTQVKIDMDFVRGLGRSDVDRRIVEAIVGVARELGIRTVAEGVEDPSTHAQVKALGVDFAQGFHLGRPEPAGEALARA